MKKEDKELLLKDLCARLAYGVKVKMPYMESPLEILSINTNGVTWVQKDTGYPIEIDWKNCKPYLFPLSSMTEKQRKKLFYLSGIDIIYGNFYTNNEFTLEETLSGINWLLKNHFDIYGLIPMGLADDATGLNIY